MFLLMVYRSIRSKKWRRQPYPANIKSPFLCRYVKSSWPARNIDQNLADLKAQVAACARGAQELEAMVGGFGRPAVDRERLCW